MGAIATAVYFEVAGTFPVALVWTREGDEESRLRFDTYSEVISANSAAADDSS